MIYVALLRGINLGGKNRLPMKELRALFTEAGCAGARTYIQSGNVIFDASSRVAARVPGFVAAQIANRFGYTTPIIVRTSEQIGVVLRGNPFLAAGAAESELHVVFLATSPSLARVQNLDPNPCPPDAFAACGQEI